MSASPGSKARQRRIGRGSAVTLGLLAATALAAGCTARGEAPPPAPGQASLAGPGFFGPPGSTFSTLIGLVLVLAIGAAIAYAVVLLVRRGRIQPNRATNASGGTPSVSAESNRRAPAEQILEERFARGELNIDEYNSRLSALRQSRSVS